MRRKALFLALTLSILAGGSLGLFSPAPAAADCPKWCCPDVDFCIICCHPPCFCPPPP